MNILQQFKTNDGLELLIDLKTGEVFASQRGLARICGVSDTTIMRWVGAAKLKVNMAQVRTPSGVQGAACYDESVVIQAIAKYKPDLLLSCAQAGLRIYLHGLAGYRYEIKSENPQPPKDTPHISRLKEKEKHIIADHLWAPFFESYPVYEYLEGKLGFKFSYYDLIDGSIGKRWRTYRTDKDWAQPEETYIHNYQDKRGSRECFAYQYGEFVAFKKYLKNIYVPLEMPEYLVDKFGKLAVKEVYEVHGILDDHVKQLTGGKISKRQKQLYLEWSRSQKVIA